jgi:hypothetical protein
MVKIFTMVKGEVDIVKDWVLYHGNLFGFKNLYIIDNFSKDGTFELLQELSNQYKINVCRLPDYKKKGEYMTSFIKTFSKNEFSFPIDIDEFIVYYDKQTNTVSCDNETIYNSMKTLPLASVYKMNYIFANPDNINGYNRATVECKNGKYSDYGSGAKSFFHSSLFNGKIDHGNHYHTTNYHLSNFCLVHYTCRNLDQMKKKIFNNVSGLGHNPFDLTYLKNIERLSPDGIHHIRYQIQILEKTYQLPIETQSDISLAMFINKILSIS